jgi:DMSO/TMAO reductase YedYZ molybdopterin-dependent catalytic subunit
VALAADAPSLKLGGDVEHAQVFTLADLKAMPSTQVDASFGTMHGQEHHVWTGVKLLDLIGKAGVKTEQAKFAILRHSVLVEGKDGYAVAVALGEMEPMAENKPVIIAYRSDAGPNDLAGLRLVVPNDQHGARQVHDVVEIDVE